MTRTNLKVTSIRTVTASFTCKKLDLKCRELFRKQNGCKVKFKICFAEANSAAGARGRQFKGKLPFDTYKFDDSMSHNAIDYRSQTFQKNELVAFCRSQGITGVSSKSTVSWMRQQLGIADPYCAPCNKFFRTGTALFAHTKTNHPIQKIETSRPTTTSMMPNSGAADSSESQVSLLATLTQGSDGNARYGDRWTCEIGECNTTNEGMYGYCGKCQAAKFYPNVSSSQVSSPVSSVHTVINHLNVSALCTTSKPKNYESSHFSVPTIAARSMSRTCKTGACQQSTAIARVNRWK